jgi:hypothetical protein
MYGQPDITADNKSKILEWLGHVARMEENRMVKRGFEGDPGGRRKTGRTRKRWLDDIEENFRLMKVKRRRKKATEREVWAKNIVWEAKVLRGLQRQAVSTLFLTGNLLVIYYLDELRDSVG